MTKFVFKEELTDKILEEFGNENSDKKGDKNDNKLS